jgi:hypothetical protein
MARTAAFKITPTYDFVGEEGEFILLWTKYSRKPKPMQVYAATLRDGANPALIFADREAGNLRCGGESRCKITSAKRAAEKKLKELINYGHEYRN